MSIEILPSPSITFVSVTGSKFALFSNRVLFSLKSPIFSSPSVPCLTSVTISFMSGFEKGSASIHRGILICIIFTGNSCNSKLNILAISCSVISFKLIAITFELYFCSKLSARFFVCGSVGFELLSKITKGFLYSFNSATTRSSAFT